MHRQSPDPYRNLTQWVAITIATLVGVALVIARDYVLPARFSSDARLVQEMIDEGRLSTDTGSFSKLAQLYQALGVGANQESAGLLTYGAFVIVTVVATYRLSGSERNYRNIGILAAVILILGSIFLGTYSKEIITIGIVAGVFFLPIGRMGEILLILMMFLYGVTYRQYWVLIAAAYVILRICVHRRITRRMLGILSLGILIIMGLGVYFYTGVSADYFRNVVNASGSRVTTETIITPLIVGMEPFAGTINVIVTWFLLLFPLPLFLKLEPYYLLTGILLTAFTVLAVRGMVWMNQKDRSAQPLLARATALLASFSLVQALFEPDYGSYLRHLAVMLPLLLILAAARPSMRRVPDSRPTAASKL